MHIYMKHRITIFFVSLIFTAFSQNIFCQQNKVGNWLIYFGNLKINNKWNFHHEAQLRNYNFIGDKNQLLIRFGIGYNVSSNLNILMGYANIETENYVNQSDLKTSFNENRLFQQLIYKNKYAGFYITNRIRIEERFFTDDFKMRCRYFLLANKPINKKEMTKNAIYLSTYNEIFLNTKNKVFDRNRLYNGIGYVLNANTRFEAGYMIQHLADKQTQQFQIITYKNLNFK